MRILLLNQAFYPDVVPTAQFGADLAAELADAGHDVTVVASRRAYDSPSRLFPAAEVWRNVKVLRVPSTALGKSARWRRAVDFVSFFMACVVRLLPLSRFDVVIAMTSPPLISALAALFVRVKGGALVSWLMDLNPDEAIAVGALRQNSILARSLSRLLRFSLSTSSAVIVLDRFMRDRILAKGVPASRIHLLPPWARSSVAYYSPSARDEFRAANGLTETFVMMYAGNLSPCHPLDTLLQAVGALSADRSIGLVFLGGGSEYRKVEEFAASRHLKNVLFLPYQKFENLAGALSAADLHFVVMGDPFVGIVHPCKIYNILAIGSPCLYIGPSPSHVTDLAASLPPGSIYCASHQDVDSTIRHIRHAAALGPRRCPAHAEVARQFAAETLVPRMIAILEGVSPASSRSADMKAGVRSAAVREP